MTTTQKPDEFAGQTREMLITQILALRDLIEQERSAFDDAQEGLKSARKQEREMRARIAELEAKR